MPSASSPEGGAANTASERVFVKIDLRLEGKTLFFQVENSRSARPANGPESGHKGIGLRNVDERIRMRFGEAGALRIDTTQAMRFRVELTLPWRTP